MTTSLATDTNPAPKTARARSHSAKQATPAWIECNGCAQKWTGLGAAHCSSPNCHRTFTSVAAFDRHRVNGICRDPATLLIQRGQRAGEPALVLIERTHWSGWGSPGEFDAEAIFGNTDNDRSHQS